MTHELKTWTEYFRAVRAGNKPFEVRKNDRDFKVGDILALKEFDPVNEVFSGQEEKRKISCILKGPGFGIEEGYCVLGLARERL